MSLFGSSYFVLALFCKTLYIVLESFAIDMQMGKLMNKSFIFYIMLFWVDSWIQMIYCSFYVITLKYIWHPKIFKLKLFSEKEPEFTILINQKRTPKNTQMSSGFFQVGSNLFTCFNANFQGRQLRRLTFLLINLNCLKTLTENSSLSSGNPESENGPNRNNTLRIPTGWSSTDFDKNIMSL